MRTLVSGARACYTAFHYQRHTAAWVCLYRAFCTSFAPALLHATLRFTAAGRTGIYRARRLTFIACPVPRARLRRSAFARAPGAQRAARCSRSTRLRCGCRRKLTRTLYEFGSGRHCLFLWVYFRALLTTNIWFRRTRTQRLKSCCANTRTSSHRCRYDALRRRHHALCPLLHAACGRRRRTGLHDTHRTYNGTTLPWQCALGVDSGQSAPIWTALRGERTNDVHAHYVLTVHVPTRTAFVLRFARS